MAKCVQGSTRPADRCSVLEWYRCLWLTICAFSYKGRRSWVVLHSASRSILICTLQPITTSPWSISTAGTLTCLSKCAATLCVSWIIFIVSCRHTHTCSHWIFLTAISVCRTLESPAPGRSSWVTSSQCSTSWNRNTQQTAYKYSTKI